MNGRILRVVLLSATSALSKPAMAATPAFRDFDRRAAAGERLSVVFFGASLTWGANATDPNLTSYRARLAERFKERYPKANFNFFDAAIGGTGSQLGVFRLDRDVLRRQPDLVFLDFSANDGINSADPESNASYESLVRRIIRDGRCPVVPAIFPFKRDATAAGTSGMTRRAAHLALAKAYHTVAADVIAFAQSRIESGEVSADDLWNTDAVHPGDSGYQLFADVAWQAYLDGVKEAAVCACPDQMLYADTYMRQARVRLSSLFATNGLPAGWRGGAPSLTAAWHDGLMSRWLDDVVIASNRQTAGGADGKEGVRPAAPARLAARFSGAMVLLFGEETMQSGRYRVFIDGKAVARPAQGGKGTTDLCDASARRFGGNRQHAQTIATGLATNVEHSLEIEPVLSADGEQELRLESICVAGGAAWVRAR